MIHEAKSLLAMTKKCGVPLIINDRLDVALASHADGIHLGQKDIPVEIARRILGKKKIIGLSCHSLGEIKQGQKQDVDYLAFGPIFKTAIKPKLSPRGIAVLKKARTLTHKPLFAIGGIKENNADQIAPLGNIGITVCRELMLSKNPLQKAQKLKQKLQWIKP